LADPVEKPKFTFEPLSPKHDRAAFSCGIPALDNYIKTQAGQSVRKNLSAVFVLTPDGKTIAGYFTLSQYSLRLDEIPEEIAKKLTKHSEVPATLIGRLATSIDYRGHGLGEMLLMDALKRCLKVSQQIGSWAVIVDAKDENAFTFYKKYGFNELPSVPNRLFMMIATISKMFE